MRPEDGWIAYGENVVGTDVLREGQKARQAATYRAIAEWIVRQGIGDVLDVGCNVAALAWFLREAGYQGAYFGVDPNPHALAIAEGLAKVAPGNLRALEFGDQDVECVVVKDIVEHLESYEPLAEAFRVARETVIVGTYLPWTDAEAVLDKHSDGYYANRYRRADIVALAARCDFNLESQLAISEATGWPNLVTFWRRQR